MLGPFEGDSVFGPLRLLSGIPIFSTDGTSFKL